MIKDPTQRLIELAAQKDAIKKWHEDVQECLAQIVEEAGCPAIFQDPATGRVFEIVEPNGKFVYFDKLTFNQTKLPGEEGKGTLSLKRAREAGFDV